MTIIIAPWPLHDHETATTPLLPSGPITTVTSGNYSQSRLPQEFIPNGTHFNLRGDDIARNLTLPWPFNFYGTNYTQLWISTDGLISFTGPDLSYLAQNGSFISKTAIAPLWTDLRTDVPMNGTTDEYTGMIDPDHLLIRWEAITYPSSFTTSYVYTNFEAILARNSTIMLNYGYNNGTVATHNLPAIIGISDGIGDSYINPVNQTNDIPSFVYRPIPGNRPIIKYFTNPAQPWIENETIIFDASASYSLNGTIISYFWGFGDNTTANTATAPHSYPAAGLLDVNLTIADSKGRRSSTIFLANVQTASARLLNIWSNARLQHYSTGTIINLHGEALSLGVVPVYGQASFLITNMRLGNRTTLLSAPQLLPDRLPFQLNATFAPLNLTARYMITITLYYTPRDPTTTYPGWLTSDSYQIRLQIIASPG